MSETSSKRQCISANSRPCLTLQQWQRLFECAVSTKTASIVHAPLIVAGAKTASASIAVALCGFVATKILAVLLGPAGMGIYSLLRQCLMAATVVAALNPQTAMAHAIVRGQRDGLLNIYLSSIFWLVCASAAAVMSIGLWYSAPVAEWLLPDVPESRRLVALLALPLAIQASSVVLLNVLQAFRAIGAASTASVAGRTDVELHPQRKRCRCYKQPEKQTRACLAGPGDASVDVVMFYGWTVRSRAMLRGDKARHIAEPPS